MVWITSGLFEMGDHFDEGGKDEVPVHSEFILYGQT